MATVEVACRYCGQAEPVKKYGKTTREQQKYRCFSCREIVQLQYLNTACKQGMKEKIIELARCQLYT